MNRSSSLSTCIGLISAIEWALKVLLIVGLFTIIPTGCNSTPKISGVWKGTIQGSERGRKNNWQGPAELILSQNSEAVTGTLSFTQPQAGRIQLPITSGIISKDSLTFSGLSQFPLGGSLELAFHGKISGTSIAGTTDMTWRGLLGTVTTTGPLTLNQ